jgi:heme exporter protein A
MQVCHLAVDDLACRRGDRVLLAKLGFALAPGQALHLAGPNGVGKSSLMRVLAGLLRPYAGTVVRQGQVALIDERPALDLHLPLARALDFWRRIDGAAPALQVDMGLDDLADVPVRYLSTGQRKRAGLARVAQSGAPIWLLDEPLNGLDARWTEAAQGLIEAHLKTGGIAVIASHQPLALGQCTSLALAEFAP